MNSQFQFIETENQREFEQPLNALNYPFTQGFVYGEWQKKAGRKIRRFIVNHNEKVIGIFQIIKFSLPFGKNILYIPHGPVLTGISENLLSELVIKLKEIAREEKAIFLRFDVFPPYNGESPIACKKISSLSYRSSFMQPRLEWALDLDKSEEELMEGMHKKHSYNIRLSEKKGVEIEIIKNSFSRYAEDFYGLLQETSRRGNFGLHSKNYYERILEASDEYQNAFLVLARRQEKILVANLIIVFGQTAYFIFGGSSYEHQNLMPSHLAHWKGIKEAKQRGLKIYNFGGIAEDFKSQPGWEGLTVFKQRFGGRIVKYGEAFDLTTRPVWHRLYSIQRGLRATP